MQSMCERGQGFVYVAFIIDVVAWRIVLWRASRMANAGFVLDAVEQAIHQRRPPQEQLVHHSPFGVMLRITLRGNGSRVAMSVD